MTSSSRSDVASMYDATAEDYASMMDEEIRSPLYARTLSSLAHRIEGLPGPLLDVACGPGHMLRAFHDGYDRTRKLIGLDLSQSMVDLAQKRLGGAARILQGDMTELSDIEARSAAGVICFFALHHLSKSEIERALERWHEVLRPGGALSLAAWEGSGAIDYGDAAELTAMKYSKAEICDWVEKAGFRIVHAVVEPVEELDMNALYLEATAVEA